MTATNDAKSVTILVPFTPPSGNVLRRKYRTPFAYKGLRDSWQHTIYYLVSSKDRAWLESMAKLGKRMSVRVTIAHRKQYDGDNAVSGCKPLLDSLVRLNMLADDSNRYLELTVEQECINSDSTRISIRESI